MTNPFEISSSEWHTTEGHSENLKLIQCPTTDIGATGGKIQDVVPELGFDDPIPNHKIPVRCVVLNDDSYRTNPATVGLDMESLTLELRRVSFMKYKSDMLHGFALNCRHDPIAQYW